MKITPRPVTAGDRVDQSRDISGFNKWAQSSRTVSFVMLVLGWFTIPAEVFFRRDFGQRWFTATSFYAGFFLMLMFASIQYVVAVVWDGIKEFISRIAAVINPFHTDQEVTMVDRVMDKSMVIFLVIYFFMGAYHRFKIWWRNRANTALHSFDDGTSRFEPIAGLLIKLINVIGIPFVFLVLLLVPRKQRKGRKIPKLINDRSAFTNTVFEPMLLLVLAFWMAGIASIWLFISAVAVAIHANWKETARLSKILDFRDSILEAKVMVQLNDETAGTSTPSRIMQQAAETIKSAPHILPHISQQYPDLSSIIEGMNQEKTHQKIESDLASAN